LEETKMPRVIGGGFLLAAGCTFLLSACASAPPPSLAQARGEVAEAGNAPADSYSQAQLDEARLKLGQAEAAAQKDETTEADRLAKESLADLQLARSLAEAQHAEGARNDMQATIHSLSVEANQSATVPPAAGAPIPNAKPQSLR
jgi:hypothetical protein